MKLDGLRHHARRQRGCFTYAQAQSAGFATSTIAWLVAHGRWEELEPQVFRVVPAGALTWEQRLTALTLSCGGVAYGRSALALYGLVRPPAELEVLVERRGRNRHRIGIHSTRTLPRSDIATVLGVRATMPARTICDGAAALSQPRVSAIVDAAVVRKLVRPSGLERRALELRNSRRPGCAKVLAALAEQHPRLDRGRNEWEALVLRLAHKHRLPSPVPNHAVVVGGETRILDAAWPAARVALEFDGFREHMVRRVFDDDRARQNSLVTAGWVVLHATSNLIRHDPDRVFAAIRAALGSRGHDPANMLEAS